jgi:hypothetical protein
VSPVLVVTPLFLESSRRVPGGVADAFECMGWFVFLDNYVHQRLKV